MNNDDVPNPNFKGFMCDTAQANFNALRIVYKSGNRSVPMIDCERTCLFYWAMIIHKDTENLIAKNSRTNTSAFVGNTKMQRR